MSARTAPLESYTVNDLEVSRMKAISVIAHCVQEEYKVEDIDCYFAEMRDPNRQHTLEIWQAYATDFSSEGRSMMVEALEANSRWSHPAEKRPDREIGNLALSVIGAELDIRKEAYGVVLPRISTAGLDITEDEERQIRSRVTESWLLTDNSYKYSHFAIAAFTKKVFKTQLLRQLVNEGQLLLATNTTN